MGRGSQILGGAVITGVSFGFGHLESAIDQVMSSVLGASGGAVQAPVDYGLLLEYGQFIFFYLGIIIMGYAGIMLTFGLVKKRLRHDEPEPEEPARPQQRRSDPRFPDQEQFEQEQDTHQNQSRQRQDRKSTRTRPPRDTDQQSSREPDPRFPNTDQPQEGTDDSRDDDEDKWEDRRTGGRRR